MISDDEIDGELSSDEPDFGSVGDNAGDPVAVRRRAKKLKYDESEAQQFWRSVFASEAGRREMWNILGPGCCHVSDVKFACGPNGFPQPEATWFQAGEQSIGERLLNSWLKLDREGVFQMLDEHDPRFTKGGG